MEAAAECDVMRIVMLNGEIGEFIECRLHHESVFRGLRQE